MDSFSLAELEKSEAPFFLDSFFQQERFQFTLSMPVHQQCQVHLQLIWKFLDENITLSVMGLSVRAC
jgi:hypothetical protein